VILFDTSVYIGAIRGELDWNVIAVPTRAGGVRLSSVVAFELLVGARSPEDKRDLRAVVRQFAQTGWVLTPTLEDWTAAADLIGRHSRVHGHIEARDHLADVLLVLSAGQVRGEIVTTDISHLRRWVRAARRSGVEVRATPLAVA